MRYALIAVALAGVCVLEWITSPTTLAALAIVLPTLAIASVAILAGRAPRDADDAPGNRRVA